MSGINLNIGATDAGFTGTIDKAKHSVKSLDNTVNSASNSIKTGFGSMVGMGAALGAGIAAVGAAFRAAQGTIASFSSALDLGGRLAELKLQTGESAGNLLVLERAFGNTGLEATQVGTAINKLQRFMAEASLGSDAQVEALARLGLTMADLEGKTPTEQMQVFARQITGIQSPTERAALAMEVFGKSGGKMLPLLMNFSDELDGAKGELGGMPDVMDRSSEAFDQLSDKMGVIKGKAVEVAAGFLEKALPALNSFANMIAGIDAAGWGARMVESILRVTDTFMGVFKNNEVGTLVGLQLVRAAKEFGNAFVNTVATVGEFLSSLFSSQIPDLIVKMGHHSWQLFIMEGEKAFAAITGSDAFRSFQSALYATFSKMGGGGESWTTYYDEMWNKQTASLKEFDDRISTTTRNLEDGLASAPRSMADEFESVIAKSSILTEDFFGAKDAALQIAMKIDEAEESGKKLRDELTKGAGGVKDNIKGAADHATTIPLSIEKAEKSAKKIKDEMSLSAQLMDKMTKQGQKDVVDKGGKLESLANNQIQRGDFKQAQKTILKIKENEAMIGIQALFSNDQGRGSQGRLSIKDLAKNAGIDTFRKSNKQLMKELGEMAKKPEGLAPGQQGKNAKEVADEKAKPAANPLLDIVTEIKRLVAKIEPKLPQHALI
jgi:hypothetical protein